jgi:hypothetical protein
VLVEPGVLDRQHRVARDLVDLVQTDDLAVLVEVQGGQHGPVGREDRGALRDPRERQVDVRPDLLELLGEMTDRLPGGPHWREEGQREERRAETHDHHEQDQADPGRGDRVHAAEEEVSPRGDSHLRQG